MKAFAKLRTGAHAASRFLVVAVFLLAAAAYGWFYHWNRCEVNSMQQAAWRLERQLKMFDHTYQFATSASRGALVRPVGALQQIAMDSQDVDVPACLRPARAELLDYMRAVIRAFQAYGSGEPRATVQGWLSQSDAHYENFRGESEKIRRCAPLCLP